MRRTHQRLPARSLTTTPSRSTCNSLSRFDAPSLKQRNHRLPSPGRSPAQCRRMSRPILGTLRVPRPGRRRRPRPRGNSRQWSKATETGVARATPSGRGGRLEAGRDPTPAASRAAPAATRTLLRPTSPCWARWDRSVRPRTTPSWRAS
jgi:hypothetical protein